MKDAAVSCTFVGQEIGQGGARTNQKSGFVPNTKNCVKHA